MTLPEAVAAYGLPTSQDLPSEPCSSEQWSALLAAVVRQRVPGLLSRAIADGALPVSDAQLGEALGVQQTAMEVALLLDRQLQRLSVTLDQAGIAHRALKGAAFAHLDYEQPSQRAYGDVDLLVPSARLDDAVAHLTSSGLRRRHPPLRPGFEARFAKTVELLGDTEVDVHRTIALEPFGWWVREEDLFAAPAPLHLGAQSVPAPPQTVRFLHACYHAALGNRPPRLSPLRDVAQMALSDRLDWREAVATARRWRGETVVAEALRVARATLRLEVDGGIWRWADHCYGGGLERRALESYRSGTRRQTERTLQAVQALPWRDRGRYLTAILRPDAAYLAERQTDRGAWLRRGGRALRDVVRR